MIFQPSAVNRAILSRSIINRNGAVVSSSASALRRAFMSTQTSDDTNSESPLAEDGRHEVWREGIYDHDNEPK